MAPKIFELKLKIFGSAWPKWDFWGHFQKWRKFVIFEKWRKSSYINGRIFRLLKILRKIEDFTIFDFSKNSGQNLRFWRPKSEIYLVSGGQSACHLFGRGLILGPLWTKWLFVTFIFGAIFRLFVQGDPKIWTKVQILGSQKCQKWRNRGASWCEGQIVFARAKVYIASLKCGLAGWNDGP